MASRSAIARKIFIAAIAASMLAPSGAEAAKVVNGDFESGTLSGWHVHQLTGAGKWFAYAGTDAPIGHRRPNPADPVQAPPQGSFAAVADQANPETLILYQDVALEPGLEHRLSLLAYYDSYKPIAVPTPNILSVDEEARRLPNGKLQKNQQLRIDVVRPEAPLESLDPADVLRPVFATKPGDPLRMTPRRLTADLSALAGQTVRIRIAVVATEEVLNGGVDAVSVTSSGPGQGGPQGRRRPVLFSFGKLSSKRRRGTATLRVRVSGPGLLRAKGRPIEPVTVPIATARTVRIRLRPTTSARALLRRRHRLRFELEVTFMPVGGLAETATRPIALQLRR